MSFYCGKYPIIEKSTLAKGIYSVYVDAPELADEAQVGQFANIAVPGFTLRRPISICGIDKERGTLRFVFEVRGKGTEALAMLTEGESLDILGPLGNGFRVPDGKRIIVVGGGIGVPPLLGVSHISGELCTAIIGFRDYSKIILPDEFKDNGSNTKRSVPRSLSIPQIEIGLRSVNPGAAIFANCPACASSASSGASTYIE